LISLLTAALREILETLNPALKLGRGNGGFRERRNLVLESQKPTNELQAAKEGLLGVRPQAARRVLGAVRPAGSQNRAEQRRQ
jgi:hypothetical protein